MMNESGGGGRYLECRQHGEDPETYLIELSHDEFELLSTFFGGWFAYDGDLDLPEDADPSSDELDGLYAIADGAVRDFGRRIDLRPAEIETAKREGRCLSCDLY